MVLSAVFSTNMFVFLIKGLGRKVPLSPQMTLYTHFCRYVKQLTFSRNRVTSPEHTVSKVQHVFILSTTHAEIKMQFSLLNVHNFTTLVKEKKGQTIYYYLPHP